ncbi:MAG TPA: HI0074 family nucleotidyltransferase substrate-binding subunit [Fimbriimonadaceae bacterium]|jgi:nucleotidyltransferase substrate binding protein (TIGR01987 family)
MAFDTQPLEKALASLRVALAEPEDQFVRDSVIKRFEFSYELSWKFLKRFIEQEIVDSHDLSTRKELFRRGVHHKLIEGFDDWVAYHDARNQTSHTYNEIRAQEVYMMAGQFLPSAELLLKRLNERTHQPPE